MLTCAASTFIDVTLAFNFNSNSNFNFNNRPGAIKEKTAKIGSTPLHTALENNASATVVTAIFTAWPEAATEKNADDNVPLYSALKAGASKTVVAALVAATPAYSTCEAFLKQGPSMDVEQFLLWFNAHKEEGDWIAKAIKGSDIAGGAAAGVALVSTKDKAPAENPSKLTMYEVRKGRDGKHWVVNHAYNSLRDHAWVPLSVGAEEDKVAPASARDAAPDADADADADEKTKQEVTETEHVQEEQEDPKDVASACDASDDEEKVTSDIEAHVCHPWVKGKNASGCTLLNTALKFDSPEAALVALLCVWPEAVKEKDYNTGSTALHLAFADDGSCSESAVLAVISAWPKAVLMKDQNGRTPLNVVLAAPPSFYTLPDDDAADTREGSASLAGREFNVTSTRVVSALLTCLQMQQFSSNTSAAAFDASAAIEYKNSLTMDRLQSYALAPASALCAGARAVTDSSSPHPNASAVASATRLHFEQMVAAQPSLSDTAPLSERLVSIKTVLNICLQTELLIAPTSCGINVNGDATEFDCSAYMQMHVDPAISLIKNELDVLKSFVRADPDKYRHLMADLSTLAGIIYDQAFGESFTGGQGSDLEAYNTMLQTCTTLPRDRAYVDADSQPTKSLIPLVLLVRANIPDFEEIIEATVAHAASDIHIWMTEAGTPPKIMFRPETKPPFRVIEKSLTKGPSSDYPDCSKVLDVFGCIIDCADYTSMAALLAAFAYRHNAGDLDLVGMVNRWTAPAMGWRDVTLNLVVNSVIFEVQISHSKMFVARTALDAHQVHNQFRSFAEIFHLLGMSSHAEKQDDVSVNGSSVEASDRVASAGAGGSSTSTADPFAAVDAADPYAADTTVVAGVISLGHGVNTDNAEKALFNEAAATNMARVTQLDAENKRLEGELKEERAARAASEALVTGLQKEIGRLRTTCKRLIKDW